MTKQMSKNEALERIEFGIRQSCPEANGSNIGECNECWRFPCNDMKALLVLRDLKEEERPQGEWEWQTEDKYRCTNCGEVVRVKEVMNVPQYNFCPMCGADMSKLQANGDQVKNELNRVSKELNSKTEYKAKVKELENAIAKCEKAEEEFKKRTCKFKSPTNCDFCSFHSDCDEHWKEGEDAPKSQEDKGTKKCPICGSDLYEHCYMCCYEGEKVKRND